MFTLFQLQQTEVAELKTSDQQWSCGFKPE
jgi:hypothetical protein